ncbi:hypothetical protein ACIQM4_27920 [Streptomyces sp. NPDC091272]|uniref:hypothetical protein n=1 Tax=Streptomyces sp. NPDC091272 TaxID=3365981 RepID=UPI0038053C1C
MAFPDVAIIGGSQSGLAAARSLRLLGLAPVVLEASGSPAGSWHPRKFEGQRVVVVGGGNSAVQIAHELAATSRVTLASRAPLSFLDQVRDARDVHHWLTSTGFDELPAPWLAPHVSGTLVLDDGRYRTALKNGRFERREMFAALDGPHVVWSEAERERVDVVLLATGCRPHLDYLTALGALDGDGMPLQAGGLSLTHPGLAYLGLEFQWSFSSNTLRGLARDAAYVSGPLAAHVRRAPAAVGL